MSRGRFLVRYSHDIELRHSCILCSCLVLLFVFCDAWKSYGKTFVRFLYYFRVIKMSSDGKKKQYLQSYRDVYAVEFPCIKKSQLGAMYAHCTVCRTDIKICCGGKTDMKSHLNSIKHRDTVKVLDTHGSNNIRTYFSFFQ